MIFYETLRELRECVEGYRIRLELRFVAHQDGMVIGVREHGEEIENGFRKNIAGVHETN